MLNFCALFTLLMVSSLPCPAQSILPTSSFGKTVVRATSEVVVPDLVRESTSNILYETFSGLAFANFAALAGVFAEGHSGLEFYNSTVMGRQLVGIGEGLGLELVFPNEAEESHFLKTGYPRKDMNEHMIHSIKTIAQSGFAQDGISGALADYTICLRLLLLTPLQITRSKLYNYAGDLPEKEVKRLITSYIVFMDNLDRITRAFSSGTTLEPKDIEEIQTLDCTLLNELFRIGASDPYRVNVVRWHDQITQTDNIIWFLELSFGELYFRLSKQPHLKGFKKFYDSLLAVRNRLGFKTEGDVKKQRHHIMRSSVATMGNEFRFSRSIFPQDLLQLLDDFMIQFTDF